MQRNSQKCNACGALVSLSNLARHTGSASCANGGKGRTRAEKYPWDQWKISEGRYRLPCGLEGTKARCRNKLNAGASGGNNLQGFNESRSRGEVASHNKGGTIGEEQRSKISMALKKHFRENGTPEVRPESRRRMSEARKGLFDRRPDLHPNRILAGNRKNMTYPEKVAMEWFERNAIEAPFNRRVGRYYPDFLVGTVIVEIDGARWHSSEEQRERDRKRDRDLLSLGYRVYRIEASSRIEDELERLKEEGVFGGVS